jgi:hypothetical protein
VIGGIGEASTATTHSPIRLEPSGSQHDDGCADTGTRAVASSDQCLGWFWLAAAIAWSWAAAWFAAAMAALPSGLPAEFPGVVADATVALQFRYSSTLSLTGAKSLPLPPIQGAFSERVTTHLASGTMSRPGLRSRL